MWRYSMGAFAEQLLALMDHLELEQAAVMGTSLGANTALEVASRAPERLRGMVIEMPVLDNALPASRADVHADPARAHVRGARDEAARARRARGPAPAAAPLRQRPARHRPPGTGSGRRAAAGPVLRAHRARIAASGARSRCPRSCSDTGATPCTRSPTRACSPPSCPHGRLLEADSLVELRLSPERLTDEIASFLDEIWRPRARGAGAPRARAERRDGAPRTARPLTAGAKRSPRHARGSGVRTCAAGDALQTYAALAPCPPAVGRTVPVRSR